jgi:hypothetical protein
VEVKLLGERELKLYEGGFYFWFDLLRPTLHKTLPALEAGRTLWATEIFQIPRLVANPDYCSFAWWMNGSQAGTGKSYTLTNADVGKTLGLGYNCGGGYEEQEPADLKAGTVLASTAPSEVCKAPEDVVYTGIFTTCMKANGKCYQCNPDRQNDCANNWLWQNADQISQSYWYIEVPCH